MTERVRTNRGKFTWRGLDLRYDRRTVLTLEADATYPNLYRIKYPNSWTSAPANLTRAKDAAYGHARHLLGAQTGAECAPSPEDTSRLTHATPDIAPGDAQRREAA